MTSASAVEAAACCTMAGVAVLLTVVIRCYRKKTVTSLAWNQLQQPVVRMNSTEVVAASSSSSSSVNMIVAVAEAVDQRRVACCNRN